MRSRDLDPVQAAVNAALGQVGPGLYGVACSGGADSLALAHAAMAVAGPRNVVVLSIDHQLQPGSAEVASRVVDWARAVGAAGVVRRVEVNREQASLEAAARDARYAALHALADELGLSVILLGHTARDQAETVLMRIIRGTGPAGLAGIPAERGVDEPTRSRACRILRPLLEATRAQVDAYVAERGLTAWDDPMNADPSLFRVRVRNHILPALRHENPQLDAALVRLASSAAEWTDAIDSFARPLAAFPIDATVLAGQPAAIRKRAVALALESRGIDYDALHLDAIDRLVIAPTAGTRFLDLPGARLSRTYDSIDVAPGDAPAAEVASTAFGDYEVRAWRPGDRMRPKRLKGSSKKLSDLFIDAKVPKPLRVGARVLIRTSSGEIVWAEHIGVAHGEADTLSPLTACSRPA
jgi:tRNA(Ile)-lysidine synthase